MPDARAADPLIVARPPSPVVDVYPSNTIVFELVPWVSIVAVFTGLATSFTPLIGELATGGLVVGSILLAPSIVLGYAIKAAEKEDRLNGN